jgi:MFS family permease
MGTTRVAQTGSTTSATRLALAGLACTSLEWYDFFLYGTAAALVFPVVFFPKTLPWFVALIASFSTFSVGFIARPLGAIIFGQIGDRAGRKTALVAAMLLMGIASTVIGLVPSYSSIGALAPLLLLALRVAQGLAIGGQWGGAVLLLTENAPARKRGYYGGFVQSGVPVGLALANVAVLAVSALPENAFLSWGWRLPFFLSIVLVGLALWVKLKFPETAAFRRAQGADPSHSKGDPGAVSAPESSPSPRQQSEPDPRSPVIQAMRLYPRQIALAAGAFIATSGTSYIVTTFVLAYASSPAGLKLPRSIALSTVLVATVLSAPASIIFGAASDRFGRRRVIISGAVLTALWGYVQFPLIETRSPIWMTVAIAVGMLLGSMMYGPLAALYTELFGTYLRYSAISLSYQIGAVFAGGLAPIIATALLAAFHGTFGISVYITALCAISLISTALLKETSRVELDRLAPTARNPAAAR